MEDINLQLLSELVNIDSGTGDQEGLSKVSEILRLKYLAMKFNWETLKAKDGSTHFFASRGEGKRVLLIAHLDTVFPKGTAVRRGFQIEGDIGRGPGVSDCKSGVVTITGALDRLSREIWPDYEIGCLFNCDEEISSPGSREIIEHLAKGAIAVLVAEPAEGENITVARKGIGRYDLKVFGKAAHSGSNYQDGRNAILEMAYKIIDIQGLSGMLPGVTLNVGVVNGGIRSNIVPDFAEAEIDLRIIKPGQAEKVYFELQKIVNEIKINGVTAKLTGGITRPPMPLTENNLRLYELFKKTALSLGVDLGIFQSGGGSDANFTAALGIPTIDGVGPIGGGHHSEDEFLNIPSLFKRIEILAEFLKGFRPEEF